MSKDQSYPKVSRSTVNRLRARGKLIVFLFVYSVASSVDERQGRYDYSTIHSIVNSVPVVHISFPTPDPEDPFPAVIPMIGFMGSFSDQNASVAEPLDLYLHGYVSSRLMKLGGTSPEEEEGLPVTVAVSLKKIISN